MRMTNRMFAIVATLALAGCTQGQEPEAVEPQTSATAGGAMTTQPQAGAEMQARTDVELEEPDWGEPPMHEHGERSAQAPQYGEPGAVTGEPYPHQQGMQPGMQQGMQPGMHQGMEPSASRQELRTQIETALRGAPNLDDNQIDVRIDDTGVYLAGLVDSPTEIRIAHDVVHSIPGVENVYTDELRVQ